MKSIIALIGDYMKYLTYIKDMPIFNTNTFLANRDKKENSFYQELVMSQMFLQFIENNCQEKYPYFHMLLLRFTQNTGNSKPEKKSVFDAVKNLFKRSSSQAVKAKNASTEKSEFNSSINKFQEAETSNMISNITKININDQNSNSNSKGNEKSTLNSNSNSKGNEKISDFSEGYYILPFFVEEELIKSDFVKLDIHLREKYKGKFNNH